MFCFNWVGIVSVKKIMIYNLQNLPTSKIIQNIKSFRFEDEEILSLLFEKHELSLSDLDYILPRVSSKIISKSFRVCVSNQDCKITNKVYRYFKNNINLGCVDDCGDDIVKLYIRNNKNINLPEFERILFFLLIETDFDNLNIKNNLGYTFLDGVVMYLKDNPNLQYNTLRFLEENKVYLNFNNIAKDYLSVSMRVVKHIRNTKLLDYIFFNFEHRYYYFNLQNSNLAMMCANYGIGIYDPNVKFISETEKSKCPSCCICFNDFDKYSVIYNIPCGHILHYKCIFIWFRKSLGASCPVCRTLVSV